VEAESPDLVIAKRLLDELKLRGFEFRRVAPVWTGRWRATGSVVTRWISSTSQDSVAIARLGVSGHRRWSFPGVHWWNVGWRAVRLMCSMRC